MNTFGTSLIVWMKGAVGGLSDRKKGGNHVEHLVPANSLREELLSEESNTPKLLIYT